MIDQRQKWDNSPALRATVKNLLINWAWHYSGGHDQLGYPDHEPFTTPPVREKPRPPEYMGQAEADTVERIFKRTGEDWPENEPRSLHELARSIRPGSYRMWLKLEFVVFAGRAEETKAKSLRMSRRTYQRRIDDALFWFWTQCA